MLTNNLCICWLNIIEINTHIFLFVSKETTVSGRFWNKGNGLPWTAGWHHILLALVIVGDQSTADGLGGVYVWQTNYVWYSSYKKGVSKLYSETEYNVSIGSDGFEHYTEGTVSTCNLALQLLCLWITGNEH